MYYIHDQLSKPDRELAPPVACGSNKLASVITAILMSSLSPACGPQGIPAVPQSREDDGDLNHGDDATGKLGGKGGDPSDGPGVGDDDDDDAGGNGEPDPCLQSQPGVEAFADQLASLPYSQRGQRLILGFPFGYEAVVRADLSLNAGEDQVTINTKLVVRAAKSGAQQQAEQDAGRYSGTVTYELVPMAKRGAVLQASAWDGVRCLVQPAEKITAALGGGTVTYTLNPPLPVIISPRGTLEAYSALGPSMRTWTAVEATVVASTVPTIVVGSKYNGRATLQAVDSETSVVTGESEAQQSLTVSADVAFELSLDFGGVEQTAALGLAPLTQYFVDTTENSFKAVMVTPGSAGGDSAASPIIFLSPH